MSLAYQAVQWNPVKRRQDLALVGAIAAVLAAYVGVTAVARPQATIETLLIRGLAITAFLLLHVVLAIGPLARLDRRFLPFLYNRRHLGVATFLLAAAHATLATIQFHALGDENPLVSVLTAYRRDALPSSIPTLAHVPFEPFGALALVVLLLMAATSHDFWLKNLGASAWKALHLGVLLAYGALVVHVALGALQSERNVVPAAITVLGAGGLLALHLAASRKEARVDAARGAARDDGFVDACALDDLRENAGRVTVVDGLRVALFRVGDRVFATSNACRHQGGPLGEGRVVDGCITCPWHGWQYRPQDGCSPPPFQEIVETYRVRIAGGRVLVHPTPLPLRHASAGAATGGAP
jgi:nitrite reductase/ring-hydroxylating ferredoxin subunit/DMSO/TMAO reductase YedYZ heme-binding membrane subunit